MRVDQHRTTVLRDHVMSGKMDFLDMRQGVGREVVHRIGREIAGRDEDIVDVQQQAAAGAPDDFRDETRLVEAALREAQIAGGVLQQHLAAENRLCLVNVIADRLKRCGRVGKRQKVAEIAGLVGGPGKMFREESWLITYGQGLEAHEMASVQPPRTADRQAHAMQGKWVEIANGGKIAVRRAAGAHVVFGMDLEEAEIRQFSQHRFVVFGLESDAAARRDVWGWC